MKLRNNYTAMGRLIFIIFFVNGIFQCLYSQDSLTLDQFINIVKSNHPVITQLQFLEERSSAFELKSKGFMDPKLEFDMDQKLFDDKNYYQQIDGSIKIPTKIGADIKVAYNSNQGVFLNNKDQLPSGGLFSAGIVMPIGKGLIFDERRKALKEIGIYRSQNEIKQQKLFNEIIYKAYLAYLDWQFAYFQYALQEQIIIVANTRLDNVKKSIETGDVAAIDSVEARINLENRKVGLTTYALALNETRQEMNLFLWGANNIPLELGSDAIPESIDLNWFLEDITEIQLKIPEIINQHLFIQELENTEQFLQNDRRLLKENLKPTLDLAYNPLLRTVRQSSEPFYNPRDFKYGIQVYYPIFTRKERGNLKMNEIEINENNLLVATKQLGIKTQLETLLQNELTIFDQESNFFKVREGYQLLLDVEMRKFQIGESSQFLINSRESQLISANNKMLDIRKKLLMNRVKVMYASQTGFN